MLIPCGFFASFLKEVHLVKNDDGQFLYCLPRNRDNPRGRYEPYDLQVVSANTARAQSLYWTVSASYITLVRNVHCIWFLVIQMYSGQPLQIHYNFG